MKIEKLIYLLGYGNILLEEQYTYLLEDLEKYQCI